MERVKKGEKYWILLMDKYGIYPLGHHRDYRYQSDDLFFEQGNYFHTKDEAEAMANKIAAVLKGADVIEMPSEEDASFESVHLLGLSGHEGDERTEEAYLDGFADCLHWLKSKIIK